MNERKKYVWEQDGILYIHDTLFPMIRVLNIKTNDCRDITNPAIIQKTIQYGEEVVACQET